MRLGCLPYLNVKPLVYTFERGGLPDGWELVYAPPGELAVMLVRGDIAAAPVSSFATFADPALQTCPGICIAADGLVDSVLMLSTRDVPDIRTVALDTGSLSGANMLRIILADLYNHRPQFIRVPPNPVSAMLEECDAALVIGNAALLHPKDGLRVFDVAEHWRRLTGLPAVFAVWAGKKMTPELVSLLQAAKEAGMHRLEEIALQQADVLGLTFDRCFDYLARRMIYDLGERELRGLEEFKRRAAAHGLIDRQSAVGVCDR